MESQTSTVVAVAEVPAVPAVVAVRGKRGPRTPTIGKSDLANAISKKKGVTVEIVSVVIDSLLEELSAALVENKVVSLPGFGKFLTKITKPRETPNPQKRGEKVQVPSKKKAKFATFSAFDKVLADSYNITEVAQSDEEPQPEPVEEPQQA